jgi:hypothetical protein
MTKRVRRREAAGQISLLPPAHQAGPRRAVGMARVVEKVEKARPLPLQDPLAGRNVGGVTMKAAWRAAIWREKGKEEGECIRPLC